MADVNATPRTALLAGATGLVGRQLLSMLLAGKQYRSVHVLLRRVPPDIEPNAKLTVHQVDFARLPASLPAVDEVFSAGVVGLAAAVSGVRVFKTNMGNVPGRQFNSPDGKTPGTSRPMTFYWKN